MPMRKGVRMRCSTPARAPCLTSGCLVHGACMRVYALQLSGHAGASSHGGDSDSELEEGEIRVAYVPGGHQEESRQPCAHMT
jgi:hypothetical protein